MSAAQEDSNPSDRAGRGLLQRNEGPVRLEGLKDLLRGQLQCFFKILNRMQLVAELVEEVRPRQGRIGLLEKAGVLNRNADLMAEAGQQSLLFLRKLAGMSPEHADGPHHAELGDERDPCCRPNAWDRPDGGGHTWSPRNIGDEDRRLCADDGPGG